MLPCGRAPIASPNRASDRKSFGEWKTILDQEIESKGLNKSRPREQILEIIVDQLEHFTVPELVKAVQKSHPELGAATIYRSIPVLVEAGILLESLSDSSRMAIYEVNSGEHHDHIVCTDCHQIFEFHDERIEKAQNELTKKLAFQVLSHRHVIYARCDKFSKKV